VVLVVKIPRVEGVDVAERIHAAPGGKAPLRERYPLVDSGPRVTTVQVGGLSVPRRATIEAFSEPLRLCLREPAVGKMIPLTCTLHGRGLAVPIHGTLRIHIASNGTTLPIRRSPNA